MTPEGRPSELEGLDLRIQAACEGSLEELGTVLEGCRQYLLAVANHAIGPELVAKAGASDIVQETFLEAHRHFGRFRGRTRPELLTWLRRILECRLANTRRWHQQTGKRAGREVGLDAFGVPDGRGLACTEPSPSGHAIGNELAEALERALAHLPETRRQAVLLRHREGCSFEEIGGRIGCSPEAARKLWNRAIHQLRNALPATG